MAGKHDPSAWETEEAVTTSGTNTFVSLHHHTTFSYLDGYGTPAEHAERIAELGLSAACVTEHGNVTSHVQHEQACDKHGLKPLFGVELYCGEVGEGATQRKNHLGVIAETDEGYRNLLRVVSRAWAEGFHYEATASGAMMQDHSEGLIVLSGCSGSLLATSLVGGKNVPEDAASYARARAVAQRFKRTFNGSYYIEVQAFPELERTRNINAGLAQLAAELNLPLVATLDVHYMRPEQSVVQEVLHGQRGRSKGKSEEDTAKAWSYDVKLALPDFDDDCDLGGHVPSSLRGHVGSVDHYVVRRLLATGLTRRQAWQAVANTAEIAQRCKVRLPKVENLRYPLPRGYDDPIALFRAWCNDGWKHRGFNVLPREERKRYLERAQYEMRLIEEKGFVDYFLVVSDIVRFAKDHGIAVGPARGSAAASLVCYLLRITEVNPMDFPTLLFERFIDINRHDLPDIDLDFDDRRRHEIREYAVAKYGAERVGNIATFTRYKGKNSLNDVGHFYDVPKWEVDAVKESIIERSSGDLRANATIEDSIELFPVIAEVFERHPELHMATRLEGNVRGMSVHAAGLVLANGPLTDVCATYTREKSDGSIVDVVSLDKYDAEYLNVMKLDALGLLTMGMVGIALDLIGMQLEDLYRLPLDDEKTIEGFRNCDVVGIFQFDGRAMRSVNEGVRPDNFMEVCDINALARPGPLHSGATAEYMDAKHGRKRPRHWHPLIDDITRHTQYQVVYQEQILQVVRNVGGFTWEEASRIRKIISKKRGEQEFNTMRAKFIAGAATHGLDKNDADAVFSMLATAGAYAFNAAHCVSYGLLAYWTMWLKQHHSTAFYVASLRKYDPKEKAPHLLRDAFKRGIKMAPLNPDLSMETWTPAGTNMVRPGFEQVHGIADKLSAVILADRRDNGPFETWKGMQRVRGVGPATVERLIEFAGTDDPLQLFALQQRIYACKEQLAQGVELPNGATLPVPTHESVEVPYERSSQNTAVVWLGIIKYKNLKDLYEAHHSRTGTHLDPSTVRDAHLKEWVVMTGEDHTDLLSITVDRWKYPRMKETIWDIVDGHDLVLVKGFKRGFQSRRAIYVTDLWVLKEEEDDEQ